MFRCNECSMVFEDEKAVWHHSASQHFEYYPHRCDHCKANGEIHLTSTEEKMKIHTDAVHQGQELNMSTLRIPIIETQLLAVDKCRLNTANSHVGINKMLRHVLNVLSDSETDSDAGGATLVVEKHSDSIYQASEAVTSEVATTAQFPQNEQGPAEEAFDPLLTETKQTKKRKMCTLADAQMKKTRNPEIIIVDEEQSENFVSTNEESLNIDVTTNALDPVPTEAEDTQDNRFEVSSNLSTVSADGITASEFNRETEQQPVQIEKSVNNNESANAKKFFRAKQVAVAKASDVEVPTTSTLADENRLECVLCHFGASQERVLTRHMISRHIGKTVLKCNYCSYQSVLADALNAHLFEKHGKGKPKEKNSPLVTSVDTPRKKK